MDERTFVDAHGVEVFSRWWLVDAPRGLVLVSHGASEHSGRYDRFARALGDSGFAAVAVDHRGHGRTAAATGRGVMGAGGGAALLDDLQELRAAAETTVGPGVPLFLFGHSMGALVALASLVHHADGLAGAVLCGFPSDVRDPPVLDPRLQAAVDAGMGDEPIVGGLSMNSAELEPARTPFDWLSRDSDEVDRYIGDPMCGDDNPLTYGFVAELFGVVAPARELLGEISCPVLLIAGTSDPAAGMGAHVTALAEALRTAAVDVDVGLYEGARHELVNETNPDQVTADVVAWLESHRTRGANGVRRAAR
jgi:alpha-beta hydrolase superfamily lysophospholipase